MNSVFNRIKTLYNLKNDADLARFLGVNPTTLAMHRKRGRLDFDRVISVCGDADLNWVFRGQSVSDQVVGYDPGQGEANDLKSELLAQLAQMRKVVERL